MNRSSAPIPLEKVSFELPEIKVINLNSGIDLYFVQKEKLPIVKLILISDSGCVNDPADKKGLTFLTSLLIDEGAGEYDALQLNNEIEKLGTVQSILVNHDTFTFSVLSLKEHFERSLELLSKIILEPRFGENDFAREKKRMLDKILQLKDEPSYIATTAFEKRLFINSPYAYPEIGYEETATAISKNDVTEFYKSNFCRSKFSAIIVGNITEGEAVELFNKQLGNLHSQKSDTIFNVSSDVTKNIYYIDKKDSAQSEIRIGNLTKTRNAEDYYAARIMNTILGGQFSSRINLNLREKRGLTYGAGSSLNYTKNAGYFEVSTAVNIKNTAEAIQEIMNEMNLIRQNISRDEIDFAKSYLIKQFPSKFETYTQIANNISPLVIHNIPIGYYNSYESEIENVTPEEIQRAALEYVKPDEAIILVVGDKKEILQQIKNLGIGEPIELNFYGNVI